jgi:hypothetical protein
MSDVNTQKVTSLEGKTTVDDKMVFEPERLSYRSADILAKKIACLVKKHVHDKDVVVIAGTNLLSDIANLQAVMVILEQMRCGYEALDQHTKNLKERMAGPEIQKSFVVDFMPGLTQAAGAVALGPLVAGINTALGLVSLFREDVDYRGNQTVVNPLAFELAMAAKIKELCAIKAFVPDLVVLPPPKTGPGSLRDGLEALQKAKASMWETVGPLISELVKLDTKLDHATRERDQTLIDEYAVKLANLRKDLSPITEQLGQLDKRKADLETEWNRTDEASGLTMLARWLRAESIQEKTPKYLHAQVVSSGGYSRISRSLLRMLLFGDGLSFMGGATVRWALLGDDGDVLDGGILSERAWDHSPSLFHPVAPEKLYLGQIITAGKRDVP